MERNDERRHAIRVPVQMKIEARGKDRVVIGEVQDLSTRGVRITCINPLPLDSECSVTLLMGGPMSQLRLGVGGRVARIEEDSMALQFTSVDPDSAFHLRNLVQSVAPHPAASARDAAIIAMQEALDGESETPPEQRGI